MNMPSNEGRLPDNERSLVVDIAVSIKFVPELGAYLIPTFLSVFRIPVLWRRISVYIPMLWRTHCAVIPDYLLPRWYLLYPSAS